jgi:hypothetical protein
MTSTSVPPSPVNALICSILQRIANAFPFLRTILQLVIGNRFGCPAP